MSPQNLRPSTRIRWEITSTVTSAQHVKYKSTLIGFTRWISWSQVRTKPTLRLRLSHFFWRFQPEFRVKEKICLGNTDKKATTLRLWNLASKKLNCTFSFVYATWLPLWRKPIKGRKKQRISPRICLVLFHLQMGRFHSQMERNTIGSSNIQQLDISCIFLLIQYNCFIFVFVFLMENIRFKLLQQQVSHSYVLCTEIQFSSNTLPIIAFFPLTEGYRPLWWSRSSSVANLQQCVNVWT